jgi:signal transduction histidine kinase/DNA-binding response OmpR family regulator
MALHSASLFVVLALGVLWARPEGGLMTYIGQFRFRLTPQLITLVVLAVLLVGGILSAIMARQSQTILREQIIASNLASAELAAEFAYRYVEGTQLSARLLARNPAVRRAVLSGRFSEATPYLQEILAVNQRLDGCSVFNGEGINRATGNVPPSNLGNRSNDRDWFQQAIATGHPYLGIPVISRGTGRPALPYAVPITDEKRQVKGVLVCGISLAALSDVIANFKTGAMAQSMLADLRQGGIILAHPDRKLILTAPNGTNEAVEVLLKGERGGMESADGSGEWNLASFAPVPYLPWGFVILQPSKAAFAPVARSTSENLLFTALLLLFAGVTSGLLARRVTRPLARLREAASSFAAGNLDRRLNMTRQDEVGELGRTFDQMAAALAERSAELKAAHQELQSQYLQIQDANRLKSEFLANMSHELRTPLNAIIGFAQLIHDGKVGAVDAGQREYLGDILTSADHLLQLINDVLDLAKVESGKLDFKPEPVSLPRLITEVRSILQPLAASKRLGISVEVETGVDQVVVDPAKLKQVLYNYLSNAIKFTPEEGQVQVRARAVAEFFRLEVHDTGIGIPASEVDKLFMPFQQLDTGVAKKHQGTGLGLALTKKIVEAQGGSVGVDSRPGEGSAFYALLPRSPDTVTERIGDPEVSAAPAESKTRVLIIEDSEPDRKWLAKTLSEAGYLVESATSGTEGISKTRAQAYAAILLDLILPDTGGWDVLHSIRAAGPNQNTPVIVVTVVAERNVAKGFPVQDYLVKPVRSEALLEALKNAGVLPLAETTRVMVVDDDLKILKLARVGLESGGYQVVCHSNGLDAIEDARRREFAAVVLDLLMPKMDGFEFLDHFRKIAQCRATPVIVWTNKDVTAADLERLKFSAQMIALKDRDGIGTVLKELHRHVPASLVQLNPTACPNGPQSKL